MAKAANNHSDVLDLHFRFHNLILSNYRQRSDGPEFLKNCEKACREMIAIAPAAARAFRNQYPKSPLPVHGGYGRLCWLLKQRGDPESDVLRAEAEKAGWVVSI